MSRVSRILYSCPNSLLKPYLQGRFEQLVCTFINSYDRDLGLKDPLYRNLNGIELYEWKFHS